MNLMKDKNVGSFILWTIINSINKQYIDYHACGKHSLT